jgi:uncharacterized protein (DUF305 family)
MRFHINQMKLATNLSITIAAVTILVTVLARGATDGNHSDLHTHSHWSELTASMDKMHMEMAAIKPSGNCDIDFVRLMLPHHQAAIDMAKTQLLYGEDPQLRRLAQEIITDQQSEIELMELWLKKQHLN